MAHTKKKNTYDFIENRILKGFFSNDLWMDKIRFDDAVACPGFSLKLENFDNNWGHLAVLHAPSLEVKIQINP